MLLFIVIIENDNIQAFKMKTFTPWKMITSSSGVNF